MATFSQISNPTPFGVYDNESPFQVDADNVVTFVKRKLGDDILSVELTKKQIFGNFEESVLESYHFLNSMARFQIYLTKQAYPKYNRHGQFSYNGAALTQLSHADYMLKKN